MELSVLLHLLASLQILPQLASPAALLQAPRVIMDPQHPVYFPGERLTLRCLAPGGEAVSSYQFYNQRGERVYTETTGLSGGLWLVLTAEMGKAGAYSCEYWAVRDGRPIYSARSQPLWVPVMDFPLAPSISAISDFPGKSPVTIVCSAPQGHVAKRYQFLRQGNVIVSQLGARLQLRQSDLDATGPYTCSYEVNVSGRMIQSLPSAPLSIHLTGSSVLLETFRPTLQLSPTGPEFTTGDSVTLTCSAPSWEKKMGFCFLKAREQVVCTRQALEDSQSYQIGRLSMEDSGSYTCMYRVAEPGQVISSLESQPISITVTDVSLPPPAPQIILYPPKHIYFQGEHVKLTCSVPGSEQVGGYRFYHQREEQISELDEGAWLERTAMTGNAGTYFCAYWIIRSGQAILSRKSDSVSIIVTAPPLAPRLSLHPKLPVYLPGEKVTLTCSVPHGKEVAGFRFHQHRGDQTPEELPAASGGPGMELMAQMGNDGSYTCQYWRREAGQEIVSENSNSITVPVSDPLPQPLLSMDPPSGEVSEGLPLLIACMAPGDLGEWRFHFYKDGTEIIPRVEGSEISTMESVSGSVNISVLSIPQAGPKNTGEFTCGYEKNMSGRWIQSPRSQAVNVTWNVTRNHSWRGWALPLPLVAGCGGGGAALGLLALLGCCCRRNKKGSSKTAAGYLGVNGAPGVNLALQQRSHDGWDQPAMHNQRRLPSIPGGKSKKRGKGEEDAGTGAGCTTLYAVATCSPVSPGSSTFHQQGGNLVSEEVVYSEPLF
ncbi:Fc receptor-like protein 5 [Caretta caretta]|uniref:Fc receptor-like protein 5 n=1 Tax=Caretta caretta TaxID=8467 RepID=UPI003F4CA868